MGTHNFYNISMPKDSAEAVAMTTLSVNAAHEGATDVVYLDQYNGGGVLRKMTFADRSLGVRVQCP